MTGRTKRLREESLAAEPAISAERALLLTEFYRENEGRWSIPVLRAKSSTSVSTSFTAGHGAPRIKAAS